MAVVSTKLSSTRALPEVFSFEFVSFTFESQSRQERTLCSSCLTVRWLGMWGAATLQPAQRTCPLLSPVSARRAVGPRRGEVSAGRAGLPGAGTKGPVPGGPRPTPVVAPSLSPPPRPLQSRRSLSCGCRCHSPHSGRALPPLDPRVCTRRGRRAPHPHTSAHAHAQGAERSPVARATRTAFWRTAVWSPWLAERWRSTGE